MVFEVYHLNVSLPSALKQFLVCSEKVGKRLFMSHMIFLKRRICYRLFMQTVTGQFM